MIDPRGNAASMSYDAMRRPTLVRNHNGGTGAALLAGRRTTYNLLGQVTSVEEATAFSGVNVTAWANAETRTYTPTGQVASVTNGAGNVSRTCYDGLDRAYRSVDPVGRARVTVFDAAGQALEVQGWWSASVADATCALTSTLPAGQTTRHLEQRQYTGNGQVDFVDDGNDNRSNYSYDGFDRLSRLEFPAAAMGQQTANANDFESYGYDANGNRTSLRLRSGETILYQYDNLNREILKDIPGATATDVFSAYDAAGRRLSARFGSTAGQGIIYGYDSAGRLTSETNTIGTSRALTYQYDIASNRTRITWPDTSPAFFAQYTYDALNRVDLVQENGATTLANYDYDARGRRDLLTRGNGTTTDYSYDAASRLASLIHDLPGGTADDQNFGFSYTPASQISQRTAANDNYNWIAPNVSRAYTRNGLNQYTAIGGTAHTYDPRGNLTNDGARTLVYDLENRLTSVSGGATATLSYDPLGRLRSYVAGGTTTEFLYDGDRLVGEYVAGALTRRYVHGPGVDEPLVQYTGSGTTNRAHLITDHQGSIIAEVGAATTRYSYGPYGEPNAWTGSRFRYTGQIALPEIQLYHYKARAYCPECGRFLQTDPVGYQDNINLYAYVHNDPMNLGDPTGMYTCGENQCPDAIVQAVNDVGLAAANATDAASQERLSALSSFFGAEGEDNGVNFVVGGNAAGSKASTSVDSEGNVTINVGESMLQNATGSRVYRVDMAATIGHEGTHGMDGRANGGNPTTVEMERATERNAVRNEVGIVHGMDRAGVRPGSVWGWNTPAGSPDLRYPSPSAPPGDVDAAINTRAETSVTNWCNQAGNTAC